MKATLAVLAVTAAGFAAATTYLHRQVNVERVRTQEEVAKSNGLEQRVRQLESEQRPKGTYARENNAVEFRAEASSTLLQPLPSVSGRSQIAATFTAVPKPGESNSDPAEPPAVQSFPLKPLEELRSEAPDSARLTLRLMRERMQEPPPR